jgi:hypothetical protein
MKRVYEVTYTCQVVADDEQHANERARVYLGITDPDVYGDAVPVNKNFKPDTIDQCVAFCRELWHSVPCIRYQTVEKALGAFLVTQGINLTPTQLQVLYSHCEMSIDRDE